MSLSQLIVYLSILGVRLGVEGSVAAGAAYPTPSSGDTLNIQGVNEYTILNPAAALSSLTLVLPGAPVDKQVQFISTTQNISTLTTNGAGRFVTGAPSSLNAGQGFGMIFNLAQLGWYPIP